MVHLVLKDRSQREGIQGGKVPNSSDLLRSDSCGAAAQEPANTAGGCSLLIPAKGEEKWASNDDNEWFRYRNSRALGPAP